MRIGVARTQVPFVYGGAERHAAELVRALERHGHQATEITLPFKWYPVETMVDCIQAATLTDISSNDDAQVDMLIGLKFPAYLMPHPNPVFWLLHQHRRAYDLWSAGDSELLEHPKGHAVKVLIEEEERRAFARSRRPIFSNSQNVTDRLKKYLNLNSTPLYHPPPLDGQFYTDSYEGAIFAPGRISPTKRVDLMLYALAKCPNSVRLEIAGAAENPTYLAGLQELARKLELDDRVHWLGEIEDAELIARYAKARAVLFTPFDEDYGYITLEAMQAGKPIITLCDSGGPLEFIRDGEEGRVIPPKPAVLAEAMTELTEDVRLAERLGQASQKRYDAMNISWETVVERLVVEGST
ncbi:MAG: glycosyltransferase family 4 protein [Cognatishimia sp.]